MRTTETSRCAVHDAAFGQKQPIEILSLKREQGVEMSANVLLVTWDGAGNIPP